MKKLTMIAAGMLFLALVLGGQEHARAGFSVLPLDDFKCYPASGTALSPKPELGVIDQFESDINTVIRPTLICNPTSVDSGGVIDLNLHLVCYTIRGTELLDSLLDILTLNMFGTQVSVARKKESLLCLPSTKICIDDDGDPITCPN